MTRAGAILVLGLAACASSPARTIPRVVDGRVERGPVMSPYAYEWFVAAELASDEGDHDNAAIDFENAAAASSTDVLLMARLAEEYERSGASRRADRALTIGRRADPKSARLLLAEGRIHEMRGDEDAAMSAMLHAHRLAPTWDEPILAIASMLYARGDRLRADALLWEHIEALPEERATDIRRFLVETSQRSGDARMLHRALSAHRASSAEWSRAAAGLLALGEGRPALAARILGEAKTPARNTDLWLRALTESGQRDRVVAFVVSREGKRWAEASERAQLLVEAGDARDALSSLKTAHHSPSVRYAKGRALFALGRFVDAAMDFADVPFGAADFEAARLGLADCAVTKGRLGLAAESLSSVPDESLSKRRKLAEIYLAAGDLRSGLRLFDPKLSRERAALAALFERAGHFEEAAAFYATVRVGADDDPGLRARSTAEQLASHDSLEGAIVVLEQWSQFAPDDLYARVRLVELLQDDHRSEAARDEGLAVLPLVIDPLLRVRLRAILERVAPIAE